MSTELHDNIERFRREIQPYFTMPCIEGESLRARVSGEAKRV